LAAVWQVVIWRKRPAGMSSDDEFEREKVFLARRKEERVE
jgi:hypothetical protein